MGLDFSHSEASWSYSRFHQFRKRLFKETSNGLDLGKMEGFTRMFDDNNDETPISFDEYNHDLRDFINHSDCEGELTPEQMKVIEPALRAQVSSWGEDGDLMSLHHQIKALQLCDGMIYAISKNENMRFI